MSTFLAVLYITILLIWNPTGADALQWGFCSLLYGSLYYSQMTGILTTNTATTYNGRQSYYVTAATGTRTFHDLSRVNSPTQTLAFTLAAPGSTGGNTNYISFAFSTPGQYLDGDGLTFNFTASGQIPWIAGHLNQGGSYDMNFWYSSPNYLEEVASVQHETSPLYSVLKIVTWTGTAPTCDPPSLQFSFCYVSESQTSITQFSGVLNTTGYPSLYSGSNLNTPVPGWVVSTGTGTRNYTDKKTGLSTISTGSVVSVGTFNGNDNVILPNKARVSLISGISFQFNSAVPVAGRPTATGTNLYIWYDSYSGQYLETNVASSLTAITPLFSAFSLEIYSGSSSTITSCLRPPVLTTTWSICSIVAVPGTYYSALSAALNTTGEVLQTNGITSYLAVSATGSRYFREYATSISVNYPIVALQDAGGLGGNDNILLPLASPYLDGNGLAFVFSQVPLIYGHETDSQATPDLNIWFADPNYDEENRGGTHESVTASYFSVKPYFFGALPSCGTQIDIQLTTGMQAWAFCSIIHGPSYLSQMSGFLFTTNPLSTHNGNSGYLLTSASGTRTFTDFTTYYPTLQVLNFTLAQTGSTGGNDNYFYPTSLGGGQYLDGDGLTFAFQQVPNIGGHLGDTQGTTNMNFWYSQSVYGEEARGTTHEQTPYYSYMTITDFSNSLTTNLPSCPVQNVLQLSFCLLISSNTYTTIVSGITGAYGAGFQGATKPYTGNGISSPQTGLMAQTVSATRTYTDLTTGGVSTATLSSVLAPASLGINDNIIYPGYDIAVDSAGLGFYADTNVPINGQNTQSQSYLLQYDPSSGQFLESNVDGSHSTVPLFSELTFQVYNSGPLPSCQLPPFTPSNKWSFCSVITSEQFTSVVTGIFSTSKVVRTSDNQFAMLVVGASGTRTYTPTATGIPEVRNIVGVQGPGGVGGNDNLIFPGAIQLLDFNGVTLQFDNIPTIYGQPAGSVDLNIWYNDPTYDEETQTGTHEVNVTSSTFTLAPYTSGPAPTCGPPSTGGGGGGSNGLSGGAIAGIVVGVVVGSLLLLGCTFWLCITVCRSQKKTTHNPTDHISDHTSDLEMSDVPAEQVRDD